MLGTCSYDELHRRSAQYARTHMRYMRKKLFYDKVALTLNIWFPTFGAALKGKNLLPLGANSFL